MASAGAAGLVLLLLLLSCALARPASAAVPAGYVFIDCGSSEEVAAAESNSLILVSSTLPVTGDPFTVSYSITTPTAAAPSSPGNITNSSLALTPQERSLRSFSGNASLESCYSINLVPGNWSLRMGFAYFNYDSQAAFPNFTVSVQDTVVDQISLADWETRALWDPVGAVPGGGTPETAHYTEYLLFLDGTSGPLRVCFRSVEEGVSPVVSSMELVPQGVREMSVLLPEVNATLALKHRYFLGDPASAPTRALDPQLRTWEVPGVDALVFLRVFWRNTRMPTYSNLTSAYAVAPTEPGLDFPPQVFQSALRGGELNFTDKINPQFLGVRFHYWPMDPSSHFLVRLLFAETEAGVTARGQRVFNITFASVLSDGNLVEFSWWPYNDTVWDGEDFDILEAAGGSPNMGVVASFYGCHPQPAEWRRNQTMMVFLSSQDSELPPILSGVEFYEVVAPTMERCTPIDLDAYSNGNAADYPPLDDGTTAESTSDGSESNGTLSAGAIVGIAVAGVLGAVFLVAGIIFLVKLRAHQRATAFQRFESEGMA